MMTPRIGILLTALVLLAGCSGPEPRDGTSINPRNRGHVGNVPNADAGFENYGQLIQHTFAQAGGDYDPVVYSTADAVYILYVSDEHTLTPQVFRRRLGKEGYIEQLTHYSESSAMMGVSLPTAYRFPALLPNDNPDRIAVSGLLDGRWDIYLFDAQTKDLKRLTNNGTDNIHPTWSPDGRKIAFSSLNPVTEDWEIRVLDLRSGTERHLTTRQGAYIQGFLPAWSPAPDDGGEYRIAFQRYRSRGEAWYELWTITEKGDRLTRITTASDWAAINAAWSPNGEYIAFATVHKSPSTQKENRWDSADDIWVVRADNTGLMHLTTHPASEWNPVWGEDPRDRRKLRIYFVTNQGGKRQIWSTGIPDDISRSAR